MTKREKKVLGLVAEGMSSKDIAGELYVSKRTVDFHLSNIFTKLKVRNRIQAVHEATRRGYISSRDLALEGA